MARSLVAECKPCGAVLELVRDGTQVTTIKGLQQFVDQHRACRARGDIVILDV